MPSGFDYSLDYKNLDLREEPHLYRVGKGVETSPTERRLAP